MKLRPSILNISALVFLAACIIYTVINYQQLSEGEGWGLVGMIGLFGFCLVLLLIDIILLNIFKSRTTANLAGLIVALVAAFLVLFC